MSEYVRLQHGAPPWEGSGNPAHHAKTYHHHDIPLIGIICQDGTNYLFHCFIGEIERLNLWSYTLIEQDEIARLESSAPGNDFDEIVASVSDRPGVVALAVDGFGIVASRTVSDWSDASPHLSALFEDLRIFMDQLRDEAQAQERRLVLTG